MVSGVNSSEVQGNIGIEDVHICVPEAVDGTNILPVTLKVVGEHSLTAGKHMGKNVFAEVMVRVGVVFVVDEVLF